MNLIREEPAVAALIGILLVILFLIAFIEVAA